MKHIDLRMRFKLVFAALVLSGPLLQAENVVVPGNIIIGDSANSGLNGWRINSIGNAQTGIFPIGDSLISPDFGPHSVLATRPGGPGVNRSFVGYYEAGHILSDLELFKWHNYAKCPSCEEEGQPQNYHNDSYVNIFIRNGFQTATVVVHSTILPNQWNEGLYNSSINNLTLRIGGDAFLITHADLMANFGTWEIYNHPNSIGLNFFGDFLGGIVMVSGSSSPNLAQTHAFDGVTIKFAGQESRYFDFVAPGVEPPAECSAVEVISYAPAKRNDGSDILPSRMDPTEALGAPQNSDVAVDEANVNFVALGFGGTLVLRLSGPVTNGPGDDLRIVETTYGASSQNCIRYPERVQVYVSQDGCHWVYTETGCQDVNIDFGPLDWAEYVKLVDISPIDGVYENQIADGYDVDGIICLNGPELDPVMQDLGALYAVDYSDFNQGNRKNGSDVVLARSNPLLSLGAPQMTNTVNFVSLGFGGSIVLKLGYAVFDKPGIDLQLTETSFGNPACASYPEKADVEVSLDKVTWIPLGLYCQDAGIDFAVGGAIAAHYVRITDHSPMSSFNGSADGYDIDGLSVLQPGCTNEGGVDQKLAAIEDDITTLDETGMLSVSPNPFKTNVSLEMVSGPEAEQMIIRVMSITGQVVYSSNVNVASNTSLIHTLDLSTLNAGMYFISVESNNSKETLKVIKQ